MQKRFRKTSGEIYSFNHIVLEIDLRGFVAGEMDARIERALAAHANVRFDDWCPPLGCPDKAP